MAFHTNKEDYPFDISNGELTLIHNEDENYFTVNYTQGVDEFNIIDGPILDENDQIIIYHNRLDAERDIQFLHLVRNLYLRV